MRFSIPLLVCLGLGGTTALADDTVQKQQTKEQQPTKAEDVDTFFETDSASLPTSASDDLKKLADWAMCDSGNAIILEGHADPRGTKDHNLELSGKRAAAVRQRLIDMGVPSQRIVITLYGELGKNKPTFKQERRVSARALNTPVEPSDLQG
jgi:peptidoglycan-associated lipoprotein